MKQNYFKIAAAAACAGLVLLQSCGSTKSVTKAAGEVEVSVPCDGYFTDAEFFRGQGVGQSKDLNTAREKARVAANAELAASISTTLKQVVEKFVSDAGQSPADYGETYESMTRQVTSQSLSNLRVACNKTTQTKDGMYKVYMAMEAGTKEVFASMERTAAAEKKLETLYDREKFRATFNEEMDKVAKEHGR